MTELRMMVGIPGSGKSSLAEGWLALGQVDRIVSSDKLRELVTGDAGDISKDKKVWELFYGTLDTYLWEGGIVVADATHLTPKSWKPLVELAEKFNIEVQAHIMRTKTELCVERNQNRERVVPAEVMSRMWWNYIEWVRPKTMKQAGIGEIFEYFEEEGGDSIGNTDQEQA